MIQLELWEEKEDETPVPLLTHFRPQNHLVPTQDRPWDSVPALSEASSQFLGTVDDKIA